MTIEIQMLKCQNYTVLSFGFWNSVNGIATPRQVWARNDKRERAEDGIRRALQRLREATA